MRGLVDVATNLSRHVDLGSEFEFNSFVVTAGAYNYRGALYNWIRHMEEQNLHNYIVLCFDKRILESVGPIHGVLILNGMNFTVSNATLGDESSFLGTRKIRQKRNISDIPIEIGLNSRSHEKRIETKQNTDFKNYKFRTRTTVNYTKLRHERAEQSRRTATKLRPSDSGGISRSTKSVNVGEGPSEYEVSDSRRWTTPRTTPRTSIQGNLRSSAPARDHDGVERGNVGQRSTISYGDRRLKVVANADHNIDAASLSSKKASKVKKDSKAPRRRGKKSSKLRATAGINPSSVDNRKKHNSEILPPPKSMKNRTSGFSFKYSTIDKAGEEVVPPGAEFKARD